MAQMHQPTIGKIGSLVKLKKKKKVLCFKGLHQENEKTTHRMGKKVTTNYLPGFVNQNVI